MIKEYDNDVSSSTVGRFVDPCSLWKHSPKAEEILTFGKEERESVIDLREMVSNMAASELDFLAEWTADVLSAVLMERRRRGVPS